MHMVSCTTPCTSVSVGNVHVDDSCQKLCAAAWFSGSPQKIESRIHLKMWVELD